MLSLFLIGFITGMSHAALTALVPAFGPPKAGISNSGRPSNSVLKRIQTIRKRHTLIAAISAAVGTS